MQNYISMEFEFELFLLVSRFVVYLEQEIIEVW